jgi:hypothetical protein
MAVNGHASVRGLVVVVAVVAVVDNKAWFPWVMFLRAVPVGSTQTCTICFDIEASRCTWR